MLGAVLAGGAASRFGSDKALAVLHGETLLARAVAALARWCDRVVVVGRAEAPAPALALPDWPAAGMGPLGGLAAALRHAHAQGCATVLSCGVDSVGLPADLVPRLSPPPRYLAAQPVIGLWPAASCDALETLLRGAGRHSLRAFAAAIDARPVQIPHDPANINTPADLAAAEDHDGL